MRRIRIFEMPSLYREPMVITGYRFGKGEKSAAIVGAMRGNEFSSSTSALSWCVGSRCLKTKAC